MRSLCHVAEGFKSRTKRRECLRPGVVKCPPFLSVLVVLGVHERGHFVIVAAVFVVAIAEYVVHAA